MATVLSPIASVLALVAELPSSAEPSSPAPPVALSLSHWSTELLDSEASTRFLLTTRASFSDGRRVFGGNSIWSFELAGRVAVTKSLGLSVLFPIALQKVGVDGAAAVAVGNIPIGITLGTTIDLGESLAGLAGLGFDLYLPTAPASNGDPGSNAAAVTRALQPQLYVEQLFSVRLRGQLGLRYRALSARAELGLVPGSTLSDDSVAVLLLSAAGRVSLRAGEVVEPFLEFGTTVQIAGGGQIAPPFSVTPGLRFHVTDLVDPAVFATFNVVQESVLLFGLDLGGALRPDSRPERRRVGGAREERLEL